MKRRQNFILLSIISLLLITTHVAISSCCKDQDNVDNNQTNKDMMNGKIINIKINSEVFRVTLFENPTVKEFKMMLPLTVDLIELNGNEKYTPLPYSLSSNPSKVDSVANGDLMLFGTQTLVLFYKNSSTSYNYTPLGKVDNVMGLTSALGSGSVRISIEFEKEK